MGRDDPAYYREFSIFFFFSFLNTELNAEQIF